MSDPLGTGTPALRHLYKEVKHRITRKLSLGEWKPGETIPSEGRLAEHFGVSVGTIRKAVDELVAENVLVRRQGRGTFVAAHTEDRTLFYFFHVVGRDGTKELPAIELLSFERTTADREASDNLGIVPGARVIRVRNLLRLSGTPVILDHITIPAARFPGLTEAAYRRRDSTIYGLYQARYGISVIRIREIGRAHV